MPKLDSQSIEQIIVDLKSGRFYSTGRKTHISYRFHSERFHVTTGDTRKREYSTRDCSEEEFRKVLRNTEYSEKVFPHLMRWIEKGRKIRRKQSE